MRLIATIPIVAALIIPAAGAGRAPSTATGESGLCSMIRISRWQSGPYLLVKGLADSVQTAPGSIRTFPAGWRSDVLPEDAVIRGQRVAFLDAVGLDGGTTRLVEERGAVLVPWGYDSACRPLRWTGSVILLPPGEEGLVVVQLRPESEWIGGVPTFDLRDPYFWPYPANSYPYRRDPDRAPSASRLLEFVRLLPTREQTQAGGAAVYAPVLDWAANHPNHAAWRPIAGVLRAIERARVDEEIGARE